MMENVNSGTNDNSAAAVAATAVLNANVDTIQVGVPDPVDVSPVNLQPHDHAHDQLVVVDPVAAVSGPDTPVGTGPPSVSLVPLPDIDTHLHSVDLADDSPSDNVPDVQDQHHIDVHQQYEMVQVHQTVEDVVNQVNIDTQEQELEEDSLSTT